MTTAGTSELYLDPHEPAFVADPYSALSRLRDAAPVHWSPPLRSWVVTRYDDVHAVLLDRQLSADTVTPFYKAQPSETRARIESLMRYLGNWLVFKDPPDHTRLRNLVSRVFTSRALEPVRANVEQITADLLAGMQPERNVDLVAAFSNPLPAYVIMDMLGVPRALLPDMKHWSDEIKLFIGAARSVPDKYDRARAGVEAMADAFRGVIETRRRAPGKDILSMLIAAHDDDDGHLTDDELIATCILFLFAGHETTTNLITMATMHMILQPAVRERFLALGTEDDVAAAVEEFLRFDGPTPSMVRIAIRDHELGGQTIKAGQRIYAMIASANRDPAAFDNPDALDLGRPPKRHYAFGYGTHFCLGAPLARLEAGIALPALHHRFPEMQLTGTPQWADGMTLRGPLTLPVSLGPRAFRLNIHRTLKPSRQPAQTGNRPMTKSSLKTVTLDLPATTEDLRKLEIGTVVYLNGRVFTAREGVYKRAVEDGITLPADLGTANFHCSPAAAIEDDGTLNVGAVTATASFRFAKWLDGWFKISGCNVIIGKGGMTSEIYRSTVRAE